MAQSAEREIAFCFGVREFADVDRANGSRSRLRIFARSGIGWTVVVSSSADNRFCVANTCDVRAHRWIRTVDRWNAYTLRDCVGACELKIQVSVFSVWDHKRIYLRAGVDLDLSDIADHCH